VLVVVTVGDGGGVGFWAIVTDAWQTCGVVVAEVTLALTLVDELRLTLLPLPEAVLEPPLMLVLPDEVVVALAVEALLVPLKSSVALIV
jgi:hypothetical protein